MYKLVKDFESHKIIFYWLDSQSKKISPSLPSIDLAKEWIIDHHFCAYEGPERRSAKIDRRRLDKHDPFSIRNPYSKGRRITDRPIKVHINLADQKIKKLVAS